MGKRFLELTPDDIVRLLQAVTADQDVRVIADGIPAGAAIAGAHFDDDTRALTIELIYHDWPEGAEERIALMYARRYGHADIASDWGAPTALARSDA